MSGANELTRDDDIDVAGIFTALKRKWWLVLLITIVVGALLVVLLSLVSPRYDSSARILIRDNNNTFTRTTRDAGTVNGRSEFDEQAIRSEVQVLGSDKLLFEVIDDLELTNIQEFDGERDYLEVRNRVLELAGQTDRIEKPRRTPIETEKRNKTLKAIKERLEVYSVERSRVLVVEFWSTNAELAQTIVAAISEKYIKQKGAAKLEDSQSATIWLDPKILELEEDVVSTEAAVAAFRSNSDLLTTDNNNALLATQQLSQVSTELSRLKAERSSAQAKVASIRAAVRSGSSLDVIPEVMQSPLVQRLTEREVEIRARISDLSTTLLPNHPRMKALNSQLGNFQSQIKTATDNIIKSLENNVDLTRKAEADLEGEIERLKAEAARVDEKLVELRALEREADAAKQLLTEYKSRSLEAKSRAGLTQVGAEIISPATLADEAFFPKIVPFTIAGMVAAMLLSVLGVIAGSLLTTVHAHHTTRPNRQEPEVEHTADAKLATSNSQNNDNSSDEAIATRERNNFKELEGILHRSREASGLGTEVATASDTNMAGSDLSSNPINGLKPHPVRFGAKVLSKLSSATIPVVSPGGDIGSSTSWILARNLAAFNRSVVLIDMSGGEISSRKMLGKKGLPGLFNLLSGAVRADQILYNDKTTSVRVVPPGTLFAEGLPPENGVILEVISAIANSFDFCVIDCGDAGVAEIEMVSGNDAVVVISCIKATASEVEELEEEFGASGYSEVIRLAADKQDLAQKHSVEKAA